MKYFFILGHNPSLSLTEIVSVLNYQKFSFKILEFSYEVLIVETKRELAADQLMEKLGGTIKIGIIKKRLNWTGFSPQSLLDLIDLGGDKKVYFGISLYHLERDSADPKHVKKIQKLGIEVKNKIKEKGRSARFVTSREQTLSSVIVETNKLLTRGAEIVIINDFNYQNNQNNQDANHKNQGLFLGKTLASQKFAEYSRRDYGRPARDAKKGMLPPKLAKIMINLAQADSHATILDPFCGLGTVLQEALLMGYERVVGSDVDEWAVEGAKRNLAWVSQNLKILPAQTGKTQNSKLFAIDVRELSKKIQTNSIEVIVTEPYLGPPQKGDEREDEIKKIVEKLSKLYLETFKEFEKVLKKGGRVVMVWPVFTKLKTRDSRFKTKEDGLFLPIVEEVKKLGFKIINPGAGLKTDKLKVKMSSRGSLIYSRPDQRVAREIWVFQK